LCDVETRHYDSGRPSPDAHRHWWQDALVYQAYVRSFADTTGDGVGDLDGIRQHLDHIASLGVDAVWLNPCYPSPQRDHGYDVADYFAIHHEYGTLDTFDAFVREAAARSIKVLMDVVPNHCSSQHQWFLDALAEAPGGPARARFYFRDGTGTDGTEPPNNWQAAFGGSAWTRANDRPDDGQWYLGTFTPHQPDFDHTNVDVQQMFADVLEFWFDRGVEGFRVDAIPPVGKHPDLPDQPPVGPEVGILDITWANPYTVFRPEGHDVWRRWRTVIDRYGAEHPDRDLMMVAEAYAVRRPELMRELTRPDEFHQMFAFDVMLSPWHKESFELSLTEPLDVLRDTGVAPAWTLNNHDVQRIVTRLGRVDADDPATWTGNNLETSSSEIDTALGTRRARALISLVFALPGSLYIYQGEELGLPEVLDIPDDRREDPVFHLTNGTKIGRDGCRIPLPWNDDPATSFGFSEVAAGTDVSTSGEVAEPWLPQPKEWGEFAVARQNVEADSVLDLYRRLSIARREFAVGQELDAAVLELPDGLVGVRRGALSAVMNLTENPIDVGAAVSGARLVFSTDHADDGNDRDDGDDRDDDRRAASTIIPACSTRWFLVDRSGA
jgi:alpha-glucosidase